MATARKELVDPEVTLYYACTASCVRNGTLLGGQNAHRKQWLLDRLIEISPYFAINVCAFAILDDQIQLLLRIDLEKLNSWSTQDIFKKWFALCLPRNKHGAPIEATKSWIEATQQDAAKMALMKSRLVDLGWFMKLLREPISRRCNKEDGCSGAFWESRFRSVAILDEESVMATSVFVDLLPQLKDPAPTRAVPALEKVAYTSIQQRLKHCVQNGMLEKMKSGSAFSSKANLEKGTWMFPIEDRSDAKSSRAPGMFESISLTGYVQLLEWTARSLRSSGNTSKLAIPAVIAQNEIDPESWLATLRILMDSKKQVGKYFGSVTRLDQVANQNGRKFLKNLTGRRFDLKKAEES